MCGEWDQGWRGDRDLLGVLGRVTGVVVGVAGEVWALVFRDPLELFEGREEAAGARAVGVVR